MAIAGNEFHEVSQPVDLQVQAGSLHRLLSMESVESVEAAPDPMPQGDPLGPADSGPSNYTRPDSLILDEVAKALATDPGIDSFDLEVECTDGHVQVRGTVPLTTTRRHLELLLASVYGIRSMSIEDVIVSKGIETRSPEAEPRAAAEGD